MAAKEAVVGIVKDGQGNIVVGKKKPQEGKWFSGKWHLPGETKKPSETDLSALARGLLEELNIQIEIPTAKFVGKHTSPTGMNVHWYECQALSTELITGSDLSDAKWVLFVEVPTECDQESVALGQRK